MPAFGLNDEVAKAFGLDDANVGQGAVTKPAIKGGQAALAYTPKKQQYEDVYTPSEDVPGYSGAPTRPYQNYTDQQMSGAEQGVNIDAAPAVDTARANFSLTQKMRDARVEQDIKAKYGQDTPTRSGADSKTGDVEWYDKDAKQWKSAGNSFGGKAVNAIPAIGEAAGGIAGSYLPLPGLSSAAGMGVGRAVGQGIKNLVGSNLSKGGLPIEDPRDATGAVNAGLTSAATGLALNTVTNGIPLAYRLAVKGKDVVTAAQADSILASYNANKKYVDQIEASTGKKYEGNVARIASMPGPNGQVNPDALKLLANEPLLLKYPELQAREIERRANRENVIELYAENELKNPDALANIDQSNWQARVKQFYDAYKDGQLGPYQDLAEQAISAAKKADGGQTVGALDTTTMGQMVRDVVLKAQAASKSKESAAWANYETVAGYKPNSVSSDLKVDLSDTLASTLNTLNDLKKKGLLGSTVAQAERYTPNLPKGKLSPEDEALMDSLGVKYEKGGQVDLSVLDRTIKDLNYEANQAAKGTVEGGMSTANRNLLLRNLKGARQEFLQGHPEVATALSQAEAETSRHSKEFKDSFLATFLVRDNAYGELRVAAPDLLDAIMKNKDKMGAEQLAALTNGEPGAKKAIVDYVDAFYNTKYTKKLPDGTLQLDAAKHRQFVREVLPSLEPFLSAQEYAKFGELGGVAKQVLLEKEKWKAAQKAWSALDEGRTGSKLTSESLVNQFFNADKSDKNFRFIKTYLGDEAVETTKAGIMSAITNKSRNAVTGRVDVDKLASLINPIRDRFETYFGADKLNSLDNLIKTAQAERVGTATNPILSGDSLVSQLAKPVLGPLSKENRKITFLRDLRQKNIAYRVEQALYDPNELSRVAREIRSRQPYAGQKARINAALVGINDIND